ncbi:MAG: nucleotidyltransferase family protein [Candidatus Eremiobacteraeota bacterium]|nr:nucleotidyltransferase family protein [Candidatus Eremiobacteraeota bacterium]
MTDARFTVVALAGGSLEADFRSAGYDVPNKAYLPVAGELMLVRVLRALRGSSAVKQIRCITQATAAARVPAAAQLCDMIVEPGPDLIGSLLTGFQGVPDDERVIIAATDMPLLTAAAVSGFAELAAQTPCDVGYGFVERGLHDRSYPNVRHTWVRLRDGTFCGAGMSVIRAGAASQIEDVLRKFTAARKSPAKLAALFSPALVLKVLTGRLGIAELERRASELTGLVCRGMSCRDAEVAVNVDRLEDLRTVEKIIAQQ